MKFPRRLVAALAVLGLATAGIRLALRREPPAVLVHTVVRGPVEATVANTRAGTVNARRRAKLAPGQGGQVAALHVRAGDRVVQGQVLIELWNADLRAQRALAESEVQRANAVAEEAQLRAELADREAERQRQLLAEQISTGERVDRADSEARAARAAQRAAAAQALVGRRQIEVVDAQLERTLVRAPFDGIVAEVNGEVGEFVTPSPVGIPTPPAVDLIDDGAPYVTAPIDEVDAALVRVGMPVRVLLDAFAARAFAGRVRRIAPYVLDREKQARTVDVEVEFVGPAPDVALLAGYSADVEIVLQQRDHAVRVPTEAVRDGTVFVRGGDGRLSLRRVGPGLANWRFTEIASGLEPGEVVVLSRDRDGVADGAVVAIEPAGAP
ncbi:MAG: efflux RND transporter periplasmic adaptor subunit [Planctomycetes bacterium]|nr:efflux RND transporter periplasmic adaptor subunit [Planctomycetota bacterium]